MCKEIQKQKKYKKKTELKDKWTNKKEKKK